MIQRTIVGIIFLSAAVFGTTNSVTGETFYRFFDDFESYTVGAKNAAGATEDLYDDQGGPWHQIIYHVAGNHVLAADNEAEIQTARVLSGTKALRLKVPNFPEATERPAKNHLLKDKRVTFDQFFFGDGDIMSVVMHLYFPSATNAWIDTKKSSNPRLLDLKIYNPACDCFKDTELRLSNSKNDGSGGSALSLNRKRFWNRKTPLDVPMDTVTQVPKDRWFKIEVRLKVGVLPEDDSVKYPDQGDGVGRGAYPFDADEPAWIQVILDDTIIFQKTMTSRGGAIDDGSQVAQVSPGITATRFASELFLDDFVIQEVASPFGESGNGNEPSKPQGRLLKVCLSVDEEALWCTESVLKP